MTAGLAVPAAGTTVPLPLNGDFEAGNLNWVVEDWAAVGNGRGEVGQAGCTGNEGVAVLGRLTTLTGLPLAKGQRLAYDYRIMTSEPALFNGLRVVVIDPLSPTSSTRVNIDLFNPNEGRGDCNTYEGSRIVTLPQNFVYGRLEFHVWGDGRGDLFHAEIDNVRLLV